MMTHEQVDRFEQCLRDAERKVEEAAQQMSDSPNLTDASGRVWEKMNHTLSLIGECIHLSHTLRPLG